MNHTHHTSHIIHHTSRITVEIALWTLIALTALALRLSHLDTAPLNIREAREAMLAWRAVTGQGMPQANYSPLLFAANALLFTLCGASDGLARAWPALFGSVLPLAPLLLRRRIGRVGALAAGMYLALSPTALFASRQLDGAMVVAVGGMALVGGLTRFFDTGRRHWLTLSACGLALAVTSSPSAYGLLLALGLAWLSLAWAWPDRHVSRFTFHVSRSSLVFLLTVLVLSTGLGWNLAGLGAAGDLLPTWIARFRPVSNPASSPLTIVVIYEPLALLFGLGGLVWAIRRGHRFGALLGLWAGLGALLLALMPGRAVLDTLWVIIPLAMLTGVAIERLVQSLRERGERLGEGFYVPVVLILWVHAYLVLARYAERGGPRDLFMVLLVIALQGLLATMFALAMRFDVALRGVAMGTGVALLAVTLSAGWGVAYVRPADPRELLVREPTAVEVRDLVQTLRDLSWCETGIPTTLPFTLEAAPDSVLAWYLRGFSAARRIEGLEGGEIGSALVTSRRDLELAGDVPNDVEFVGQDFALRRSWSLAELGCTWEWPPRCNAAVKWLLLRRAPPLPVADQWAVLWLRQDEMGLEIGD
jgi:uncharacterized protein (TIGR03663 family)